MLINCPKCGVLFENFSNGYIKKFCSRPCANSRIQTEEMNSSRREKLKKYPIESKKENETTIENKLKRTKQCPACMQQFIVNRSNRKYCSVSCSSSKGGGYREGSGRAKTGYYNGIYCGSTYELVWVIYQIEHNLEFSRFPGMLEHGGVRYYPDFIQNNKIIEIKGYEHQNSVDRKTAVANYHGYVVEVLRKHDLIKEFDYVESKYGKDVKKLYDDYAPKYNYTCSCCGNLFTRDSLINTEKRYCSRSCSGTRVRKN